MMDKTIKIEILTPYGKYLESDILFLEVQTIDFRLGILPGHTPLISALPISIMKIKFIDTTYSYSIGGGVINITKDRITLLLDSIEREDEIDLSRAKAALERANNRLIERKEYLDEKRAKLALSRAQNRISLLERNS